MTVLTVLTVLSSFDLGPQESGPVKRVSRNGFAPHLTVFEEPGGPLASFNSL